MIPPRTICYLLSHYVSHRQAGLAYLDCLRRLGVTLVDTRAEADVVIIHNEPWSVAGYYRAFPDLRERHVIVYAVWETDHLPAHYRFNLSLATEIWTCSDYCRRTLVEAGRPVAVVPHVVSVPAPSVDAEARLRERIGTPRPGEFLFYTIVNAANVRKGAEDMILAFAGLFPEGEARFIVKTTAPLPPALAATPGVTEIAGMIGNDEIYALHRAGAAFVSAHHSEGWGLAITDAMACGTLVVATAHGGNMEYMNAGNSLPVACAVEPIREADLKRQDLLTPDMQWAYADPADLRRQLRRAYDERDTLRPLVAQAQRDMERYGPERITEILEARLAALA